MHFLTVFTLQWQSWIPGTEPGCLPKPWIFTIRSSADKCVDPYLRPQLVLYQPFLSLSSRGLLKKGKYNWIKDQVHSALFITNANPLGSLNISQGCSFLPFKQYSFQLEKPRHGVNLGIRQLQGIHYPYQPRFPARQSLERLPISSM